MSAAPAYYAYPERSTTRSPQRAPRRTTRDQISVVPGRRQATQRAPQQSNLVLVAKVVAIALVVVACVGIARIALTAATVTTSIQSQELSSKIDDARSDGVALEANQSVLATSTRIKDEAADLGMAAPSNVENLTLPEDVVVLDDNGNISLSKSLAAAARAEA